MLMCARLRYVAGSHWETKRYMRMKCLDGSTAGELAS
jgi:hypothetical protein